MVKCCKYPFEKIRIQYDGKVYFCCDEHCNFYDIGNIYEDSFEDIWYGPKAQEFRKSVFEGSYKYCNLDICFCNNGSNLKDIKEDYIKNPPYPTVIDISLCRSCNIKCKTCRDDLKVETPKNTEFLNSIFDKLISICKNANTVFLNGSGELFVSPFLKSVTQTISSKYPKIRFDIISNGLLCDEKHIKDFGLENKLDCVSISVHAGKKKTYKNIVRGNNWDVVQKNLKYLSRLKKQGDLKSFNLNFVFHSLNFREMPAFVKLANKYGATACFWAFRKWNDETKMFRRYHRYTCWKPDHPDYNEFIKVLGKLKNMKGYVLKEEYFRKLQASIKTKVPFWKRFFKK